MGGGLRLPSDGGWGCDRQVEEVGGTALRSRIMSRSTPSSSPCDACPTAVAGPGKGRDLTLSPARQAHALAC